MEIDISVIVPVYNSELFLDRCINSIVNQTLKSFEIVLVDDGSTDMSGKICDVYAEKYKNIKVIHQENAGHAAARNKGFSVSKGKYVCFIDSDDVIHFQMLEFLYSAIIDNDVPISMCCNSSGGGGQCTKGVL